jgi:hypothetical protein
MSSSSTDRRLKSITDAHQTKSKKSLPGMNFGAVDESLS